MPQISERLEALEKLSEDEEGAIALPTAVDEKVYFGALEVQPDVSLPPQLSVVPGS